jgi:hypothetical protein
MSTTTELLVTNVPITCDEAFLRAWVEARGFRVSVLRMIKDTISATDPGFARVQLMNQSRIGEAVRALDGQRVQGSPVKTMEVPVVIQVRAGDSGVN